MNSYKLYLEYLSIAKEELGPGPVDPYKEECDRYEELGIINDDFELTYQLMCDLTPIDMSLSFKEGDEIEYLDEFGYGVVKLCDWFDVKVWCKYIIDDYEYNTKLKNKVNSLIENHK
jgi:hypothetical protein